MLGGLEHLSSAAKLGEPGLSSLERSRLWGGLIAASQCLKEAQSHRRKAFDWKRGDLDQMLGRTVRVRRQKRRGEPDDSGQARKRRRLVASSAGGTSEAEPVDPRENAVEEVIDLPDRSSETEVSDLTDDDSVVQQEQSQQDPRLLRAADNSAALLTNDDEEELRDSDEEELRDSDGSEDDISCPICMDFYSEILQSERLFLSTVCGHVFCSQCLPTAIEIAGTCPICRTEVTHEQYNPIFI
ncbi:E3 ubiquitin-protein ligase RNF4 [Pitangus sulphuratus]|nr:E3 ubiquitin-protein ligase RNF4 [Pitangus sulphuratus]